MSAIFKPYTDPDLVIGRGQIFFIEPSEPGISRRRRRRLRGKRQAGLLPPIVAELGSCAGVEISRTGRGAA